MLSICRLGKGIQFRRVHSMGEPRSRSYLHRPSLKYLLLSYSNDEAPLGQQRHQAGEGRKQGDNVSPGLFTACLQNAVLDKSNWENHMINIDGKHLPHLDFAGDIIMMAHSPQELEKMLNSIHTTSKPVGLNLHLEKTKITLNKRTNTIVDGTTIEQVESYIYLGRIIMKTTTFCRR